MVTVARSRRLHWMAALGAGAPLAAMLLGCQGRSATANSGAEGAEAGAARDVRGSVAVDGRQRTYLLHLPGRRPRGGRATSPRPIVVALHGRAGTGAGTAAITRLDPLADRHGFAVLYPDGFRRSWADGRGETPADKAKVDDVKFIRALLDEAGRRYHLDTRRAIVTGISNGGFLTHRLGCEMADRLAAIIPVIAGMSPQVAVGCRPARPVPTLLIMGTEDPLVPYEGGEMSGGRGSTLSARDTINRWARLDRCFGAPVETEVPDVVEDGTHVRTLRWSTCAAAAAAQLTTMVGAGHTWPGSDRGTGPTTGQFDGADAVWEFAAPYVR
jgi:polyhydroxybutyrate depolymerase